jgi:glycosyltransferase involved in cell wall biosynthesis
VISIIIPCYNARPYLEASIGSVLNQETADLELVVVDDGSTDGTPQFVRERFPGARLIEQPNQGVASARNAGIRAARGDWVAFLDADDFWLPRKLQLQLAAAQGNPAVQLICGSWKEWISSDPGPSPDIIDSALATTCDAEFESRARWLYPELLLDCCVWTSTVLIRRELLTRIGVFDPSLTIGEDYELWVRASRETEIIHISRPLALYRQHPASITKRVPRENFRALVIENALSKWGVDDGHGNSASWRAVNKSLSRVWREYAEANLAAGQSEKAIKASLRSIRLNPGEISNWKSALKIMLRNRPENSNPQ